MYNSFGLLNNLNGKLKLGICGKIYYMIPGTEKPYQNKNLILFNVVMMSFMATLDSSIVNVALPKMTKDLSVTTEMITWIVTIYLIVITSTILISGRLGDIRGITSVFKMGIVLFTTGSLLCGLADSFLFLIFARVIQAAGASATMATNFGIITQVFPSTERGKALGISGTAVALGTMAGPSLGGFIVDSLSWNYIFLINVPVGIIALILAQKALPRFAKKESEKADIKGAALYFSTVVLFFLGLNVIEHTGYLHPVSLICFTGVILTLTGFIRIEKKSDSPLLDFKIFNNSLFTLSIFCGFCSFVALGCSNIIQPFYLQNTLRLSPSICGLVLIVYPLVLSVVSPVSGYLSDKIGSEFLTFLGLSLLSLSFFLMADLHEHSQLSSFVIFLIIMSVGNGMFQSPNNALVMSTVDKNKLGIAGSFNSFARNLGLVLGTSISTLLLYSRMSSKLGYHVTDYVQNRDDVFIYGMKGVYIAAGLICTLGAFLTAWRIYQRKTQHQKDANISGEIV